MLAGLESPGEREFVLAGSRGLERRAQRVKQPMLKTPGEEMSRGAEPQHRPRELELLPSSLCLASRGPRCLAAEGRRWRGCCTSKASASHAPGKPLSPWALVLPTLLFSVAAPQNLAAAVSPQLRVCGSVHQLTPSKPVSEAMLTAPVPGTAGVGSSPRAPRRTRLFPEGEVPLLC